MTAEENAHTFVGLRNWWTRHDKLVLYSSTVVMALAAILWLAYEFYRLLWQPDYLLGVRIWPGGIDLGLFHRLIHQWFQGESVYLLEKNATYPPASYAMLWPFLGWVSLKWSIWLWAFTALLALAWLVFLILRGSEADSFRDRVFISLIPLSMYATGAAVGNGQLITHILPFLISGLLLVRGSERGWRSHLLGASFIIFALVKPSLSVPFFWILVFVPGRLRPALITVIGYAAVTLFAALFQEADLFGLFQGWFSNSFNIVSSPYFSFSTNNVHTLLALLGMEKWISPVSLLILALLGFWVFLHRRQDIWVLMGVTAVTARLWTYHGWYDDLLILLPMITLYRITRQGSKSGGYDILAGLLLGIIIAFMIAPGGLYLLKPPWKGMYLAAQTVLWVITMAFLVHFAWRRRTGEPRCSII